MKKISKSLQHSLLRQPESGMGYQFVNITYEDNTKKQGIAYNATVIDISPEDKSASDRFTSEIVESHPQFGFQEMYKSASLSTDIKNVEVIKRRDLTEKTAYTSKKSTPEGAEDAPVEKTDKDEEFVRFSSYEDDKRVDFENQRFLPGTYTAPKNDADHAVENENLVEYYALPSPDPPEYFFHAITFKGTKVQRGIVQPNFGQPGGGKEALFPNGTKDNSLHDHGEISDY